MKIPYKALTLSAAVLVIGSLLGMRPQKSQSQAALQLHRQNKALTDKNKARYQKQPYVTLCVMQPTNGYASLNRCVNYLFNSKRFPYGYKKTADQDWHISTMVLAVPFSSPNMKREAQKAMADLRTIIKQYKQQLNGITYRFMSLESIGTNKHIAAHFRFKDTHMRCQFLEAYAHIINEFLQKYPNAWMYYGYETIPHISIARTSNPGGKVIMDTTGCTPLPGKKNIIADVTLMHAGRNLFISSGYYDPQTHSIEYQQSKPI